MESCCCVSGGKDVSDETNPSYDNFPRSKNALMSWDLKTPFSFGDNLLVSGEKATDNQGLGEELIGKHAADYSIRGSLNSKTDGGKIINPFSVRLNAFSIDGESTSRLSSSAVDSSCRGSSFIDLKIGRFCDPGDCQNPRICRSTPILSSSESSAPPKRGRMGVTSCSAYCQVYGCNKDLSLSKDYHKRHKVCDVHSKAAKVIVNGIEQRFCQQCSRFHLLAEFDDGKRSCRKRLAGHNERRRKPQVGVHSGNTGTLLQSYYDSAGIAGGRFHGTATMKTSFICQDILPAGPSHGEKYGTNNWYKRIKIEDGTNFTPLSTIPTTGGHRHSRILYPSNSFEKQFPSFQDNGASTPSGSFFTENHRHPHDTGGPISCSSSLLHDTPLGNEGFSAFESTTTIHGLSEITDSGSALSLLSPQSQNSSSPSSGIPIAHQLVVPGRNTHYNTYQVSKLIGIGSQACPNGVSNRFSSTGMSYAGGSHLDSIRIPDCSNAINYDITEGIYQGSHSLSGKDRLSCEDDATISLLQLPSQLQQVERHKQSLQVKQENDAFYCSRIT